MKILKIKSLKERIPLQIVIHKGNGTSVLDFN
jgi:hypothetical protein